MPPHRVISFPKKGTRRAVVIGALTGNRHAPVFLDLAPPIELSGVGSQIFANAEERRFEVGGCSQIDQTCIFKASDVLQRQRRELAAAHP